MPLLDETRAAWSARSPLRALSPVDPAARDEVMFHHTGDRALALAGRPHAMCLAYLAAYQRLHQAAPRGWKDLGYNVAVCPHGIATEGRGLDVEGSHCPDHNRTAYGVLLLVGGDEALPPAMLARAAALVVALRARSGRLELLGHRDGTATECPGAKVYAWVKAGAKSPTPPPPAPRPPAPPVPTYPGRQLRRGDTGAQVRTVQTRLRARGWSIAVDGSFGPAMERTVRQFQTNKKLRVDGIVGPATWAALWALPVT